MMQIAKFLSFARPQAFLRWVIFATDWTHQIAAGLIRLSISLLRLCFLVLFSCVRLSLTVGDLTCACSPEELEYGAL